MTHMLGNQSTDEANSAGPAVTVAAQHDPALSESPDSEALRAYTKAKLGIASQLRLLKEILNQRGSQSRSKQCEDLMAKLAEDRFTLAVLGQFKRGKSSLMNAIIGRELLPVGVLPLTSAVTVLKFGPKERLLIRPKDHDFVFPEDVGRLADYVTEKGNPGNRKRVKTAALELPVPFLRRGLEFVDTPGVGSAIEANTATTYSFLPECDAVLFVTGVETPFTRVELEFLKDIRQHVRKIFFVLNKTDLLPAREREEVLDFVKNAIRDQMCEAEVKVFPVSARLGLAARLAGDLAGYAQSGLKKLEEALADFLTGEKASVFLSAVVDRAMRLVEAESVEVELRKRAHQIPQAVLHERLETLTGRFRQQAADREQFLERLRQRVIQEAANLVTRDLQEFLVAQQAVSSRNLNRWVAHCRWRPTRLAAQRAASHLLRLLRAKTWKWLSSQTERLNFATDPQLLEEAGVLQANVGEIPRLAGDVFGVEVGEHLGSELIPPFRLQVTVEPPFLPDVRWRPRVPGLLLWLPAVCTRTWLRRLFAREWRGWRETYRDSVIAFVGNAVSDAFDAWSREVTQRATEMGARVLAAITHDQPTPQTTQHHHERQQGDAQWSGAALEAVRDRLAALRGDILALQTGQALERHDEQPALALETAQAVPSPLPVELPDAQVVETDLATDLRTRGCAVCEHLTRFAFQFLSRWQYALYTDEKAQSDFAAELSFCPLHTWQLEAVSSPVGASVGHAKLVENISRLIARTLQTTTAGQSLLDHVRDARNCRLCRLLRETEAQYIERLATFDWGPDGRAAYARSQGLCLRHLALLVSASAGEQVAEFLMTGAARRFEELAEDMQSYGMKTDALRRHLGNEDEKDAYVRALVHIAGSRGVCCPWNKDVEI